MEEEAEFDFSSNAPQSGTFGGVTIIQPSQLNAGANTNNEPSQTDKADRERVRREESSEVSAAEETNQSCELNAIINNEMNASGASIS